MTAIVTDSDDLRAEAARIAVALLRFESVAAHQSTSSTSPGMLRVGTDAYVFLPSWRSVPNDQVDTFLLTLPSPMMLLPTTRRGIISLVLVHELGGERRSWAEKTLSNFAGLLEEMATELGLVPQSRILVEFDEESHVFSFAAVREWSQRFAVHVGWSVGPIENDDGIDACMGLVRGDGQWFKGRSCMRPDLRPTHEPESEAT